MKKLAIAVVPFGAAVAGGGYFFFLKPKPPAERPKIAGAVVPLDGEFVVNLSGGHYAKLSVAVVVEGAAHGAELEQEPAVRSVITDEVTGAHERDLVERAARHALLRRILKSLHRSTDEDIDDVLLTDLTVQ